jgi:hypothetical protein
MDMEREAIPNDRGLLACRIRSESNFILLAQACIFPRSKEPQVSSSRVRSFLNEHRPPDKAVKQAIDKNWPKPDKDIAFNPHFGNCEEEVSHLSNAHFQPGSAWIALALTPFEASCIHKSLQPGRTAFSWQPRRRSS